MTEWAFSDGTEVSAAGVVTGTSVFSHGLRYDLDSVSRGLRVPVFVGQRPCAAVLLERGNENLMAIWLLDRAYIAKVRLLAGPKPTPVTGSDQFVPDRIY